MQGTHLVLHELLSTSEDVATKDQVAWALGNIMGDSAVARDMVIQTGTLSVMCEQLTDVKADSPLFSTTLWALTNACRGRPRPSARAIEGVVECLCKVLQRPMPRECLDNALWSLTYACDSHEECAKQVLQSSGALQALFSALGEPDKRVNVPAVRTIGSILSGPDEHCCYLVELGIVRLMKRILLSGSASTLVKEVLWGLSNIAATAETQEDLMAEPGLLESIFNAASDSHGTSRRSAGVQKEAIITVVNLLCPSPPERRKDMVERGVIRLLRAAAALPIQKDYMKELLESLLNGDGADVYGERLVKEMEEAGLEELLASTYKEDPLFELVEEFIWSHKKE